MSRTKHHGNRKKEALFGDDWNWCSNEPKWWRSMMKHRKRRAEWKRIKASVKDWDNQVYPMDKRPWSYYW